MAARWRMRWRVVRLSSESGGVNGILALIVCALASGADETKHDIPEITRAPAEYAKRVPTVTQGPLVYFDWFEYTGRDAVFDQPSPPGTYRNPVLPGFYPDPSVTRVGDVFYLVNSTFTYFPGIPIFASRDLAHWEQIGNVIDRPGEFNFDRLGVSRGIFAPTIRFHNGVFYVIGTAVDSGGSFLSTAVDPRGPWSDPVWLKPLDGIDPSLFFDSDGKVYVLNSGPPVGPPRYDGHRAIWIQELDLGARKLVGPRKVLINGGVDFSKQPAWIEGPHMYRHDGWYILMCAEGGTSTQHSEVVLRARSPWGPFKPFAGNPILTQRDLPAGRANPIANAGHADLVEADNGTWWAVFLASRLYEGVHYNTGRETFVLPVTWRNGWPSILPAGKAIPYVVESPMVDAPKFSDVARQPIPPTAAAPAAATAPTALMAPPATGNFSWRDDFNTHVLAPQWLYVRIPRLPWADLAYRPGWLTVHVLRVPLESLQNMSFLARRQQHLSFAAGTELEIPANPGVSAGIAAFQNENFWYLLGVRRQPVGGGSPVSRAELFLEKRAGNHTETIAATSLHDGAARLKLEIVGNGREYSFYSDQDGSGWKPLKEHTDGTILSTDVARGFVGAMVGPYARVD
jgi:xylan 1,4-beta-xylosidase